MGTRTTPSRATIPKTRYLFFGGKGGVGKTTCAAATALLLLDKAKAGEKLLLFSTDPAHSLADSLGVSVGNRIKNVASHNGAGLDAWEMNAMAALDDFKERHSAVLKTIADRGTLLDDADINSLLNLSLPGMDEVMALFELSEFDRQEQYSRIIVDTAPSGHTTRLLQLPQVFSRWIQALDRMSDKHRYMVSHIGRRGPAGVDSVDAFLNDLTERVERVRQVLYSAEKSSFIMVTIPELMAVEETRRYVGGVQEQGVPLTDLVVNRVEMPHRSCVYCKARVEAQKPYLKQLEKEFGSLRQHRIPLMPAEVRGVGDLRVFGEVLWNGSRKNADSGMRNAEWRDASSFHSAFRIPHSAFGSLKRVFIIGGKGGVGKTTTASALAIALAEQYPNDRFLIVSTDPAHSLSDSAGVAIGTFKKGICGIENLDGIEIDSIETFDHLKQRYRRWIDEIFTALTGGSNWHVEFDREAMQELIALAPPGMDEIAALSTISDFLEGETYTSIVLDTAPTGHLLRFLELPTVALEWVRTFIKLLLKYRTVVTSSSVAEELISLSKGIKRVMGVLKDSKLAELIAVAIPEQMSLAETADLTVSLDTLGIPFGHIVINNVVPVAATNCTFCGERRERQLQYVDQFEKAFQGRAALLVSPQMSSEVRGAPKLREFWAGLSEVVRSKARGKGEA